MDNNELMMLMACRHAVVSKIQEGNSDFAHRNDDGEWDMVTYRDVVDWLDEQIKKVDLVID
jgi:hypothetical protein